MEKVNLLLVDDEQEVLDLWKVHFESDQFNIFEALSGADALKILDRLKTDFQKQLLIVLLDVKMPNLNGLAVLETIRKEMPTAKIFIITGNVENDEIPDTAYFTGKLGGDGFFEKSKIDFDLLKKKIDDIIQHERSKLKQVEDIQRALQEKGTKAEIKTPYKI